MRVRGSKVILNAEDTEGLIMMDKVIRRLKETRPEIYREILEEVVLDEAH